jgi:hypothetical protein
MIRLFIVEQLYRADQILQENLIIMIKYDKVLKIILNF